ncbi:Chaperone DnaJ-domain superfamily protein [Zea mays]|uniref:Chaperone DnaJ-domain superfamily protein n=1 Tax=Zea mays TaxID=4577 RepID=A0A1D6HRS8_MAIZE|nr:Chaperone DnaJ-domain superfamily protein [Zea mays]
MAGRREGEHQASPWRSGTPAAEEDSGAFPSAIIFFALVGATATTAAERIRHMQDVFKKERSKCRDYRNWDSHNPNYYQHHQRDDWYWNAEAFYANQRTNFRAMTREAMTYTMSHHYSVLGLDRSRSEPFSDAEIKVCLLPVHFVSTEYHSAERQKECNLLC